VKNGLCVDIEKGTDTGSDDDDINNESGGMGVEDHEESFLDNTRDREDAGTAPSLNLRASTTLSELFRGKPCRSGSLQINDGLVW